MTGSEYRAAARMAWRDARRNRWRSVLVVAMIALPIAGLTTAAVSIRTAAATPDEQVTRYMGRSDLATLGYLSDSAAAWEPDRYLKVLPAGSEIATARSLGGSTIVAGAYHYVNLVDADLDGPAAGMYRVTEGRAPEARNEVAVDPRVLERRGLAIGDTMTVDEPALELTVVGEAVAPEALWDPVALLAPGALARYEDTSWSLLIDLPDGASVPGTLATLRREFPIFNDNYVWDRKTAVEEATSEGQALGISFAIAALALAETGLIAAAAFTVGARRRLRALGLMAAAGGDRRHVRLTVLASGVVLGLIGSVAGVILGLGGAVAVYPYLDFIAGRLTGGLDPSPVFLLAAVALGTGAATLAALAPAKAATRIDPLDALAGRTPPPPPPGRLARWGLGATVVGGVITGWGSLKYEGIVQAIGLVMLVAGFLVLIPTMVKWLGDNAHRLPTAGRLAARDTARHASRTGAAVAAATVALAMPVAVAATVGSMESAQSAIPGLAPDHLVVQAGFEGSSDPELLIDDLRAAFPGTVAVDLRMASWDPDAYPVLDELAGGDAGADWMIWAQVPGTGSDLEQPDGAMLMIGDAEALRALHADEAVAALEAGQVVALAGMRPGTTPIEMDAPPKSVSGEWYRLSLPVYDAPVSRYDDSSLPGFVISEKRASELGLTPSIYSQGFLLRLPSDLTDTMLEEARTIASTYAGTAVYSAADIDPESTAFKVIAFGVGALIALAILTVAIALVASESRRDQAILTAVGADPLMRRKVAGMSGLLLAALAAVLAIPAGFVPVAIIGSSQPVPDPIVVPWLTMAAVAILVPMIAGLGAAFASKEPSTRRMLDPVA